MMNKYYYSTILCLCIQLCFSIDQHHTNTNKLVESNVLQQFYQDLQGGLPIDELLPQIVTKTIITINDKISITESGKNINERCQFFLDHFIAKPLSAGDPIPLYKLLQVMESSFKCILLATRIKHSLKIESLQDKISGKFKVAEQKHNAYMYTCSCGYVKLHCTLTEKYSTDLM